MKIIETALPGVVRIEPQVFGDNRGMFFETWQAQRYQKADISGPFVQANFATSQQSVVRGLHYQLKYPQGKLVWVTKGEVFDVVVDIGIHMRPALFVVNAALHDMEQMRDHTAGCKTLAVIVEVKSPRVG